MASSWAKVIRTMLMLWHVGASFIHDAGSFYRGNMKIVEVITLKKDDVTLYRWTNITNFYKILKTNTIPAAKDWAHFIEKENRLVHGSSWSYDPMRWFLRELPICIVTSKNLIKNKSFSINGNRVWAQTKAHLDTTGTWDPNAYKLEDETPNEEFVEGSITPAISIIKMVIIRN
jgi:hypothetical protein